MKLWQPQTCSITVTLGVYSFTATGPPANVGLAYQNFITQVAAITEINRDAILHAVDSAAMVQATKSTGGSAH